MSEPTRAETARWRDLLIGGHLPRFCILCLGVWLHAADTLLVATLMPTAVRDIGGLAYIGWTIALYEVGSIIAGAATALLARRIGLRQAMVTAGIVYGTGCVASALAPDMATMLIGRSLQGLGGGCLVALAYVATGQLFPDSLWPRLMAIVSSVWGASALCGPLIGGLFASWGLWRGGFWAFAVQAALLVVAALVLLRNQDRPPETGGRVPLRRLTLLGGAILLIAWAGAEPAPMRSSLACAAALFLFWFFLRLDQGHAARLLPRRPFDPRASVGAALLTVLSLSIATIPFTTYGPFFLAALFGADPLTAGYLIAVESVAWTLAAILFAGTRARAERIIIRSGAFVVTLGVIGFALVASGGPLVAWAACAFLMGAGFGMSWAFIMRRAVTAAASEDRDRTASALPTMQLVGYALGAAVSGLVANAAGFEQDLAAQEARRVAVVLFVAFIPFALCGLASATGIGGDRRTG